MATGRRGRRPRLPAPWRPPPSRHAQKPGSGPRRCRQNRSPMNGCPTRSARPPLRAALSTAG
eukprot:3552323-Pyramimonas_sp.AAC.1